MASAWGGSWASHWGNSWGAVSVTTAVHDGGDGATKAELDALRRHHQALERSQAQSKARKRAAERQLEAALALAFRKATGEPEPVQDALLEAAKEAGVPSLPAKGETTNPLLLLDWSGVAQEIGHLTALIAAVEAAQIAASQAEEDDIETLLLLAA